MYINIIFSFQKNMHHSGKTPRVGLEPTTPRLTAVCSTIELSRTTSFFSCCTLKTSYRIPTDLPQTFFSSLWLALWPSLRPISGSPLHALLHFHSCPIYLVVSQGPYPFGGYLILGRASRLDAFSAYPSRAWLPCRGGGPPTGAPAARPARSSRTGAGPPQISCARAG